ncbi:MAG TPA: isoprenyl transferase [Patescibacteria group bacterium]|nr:isoprenyl transferase [Patescibacteria group bacterium]
MWKKWFSKKNVSVSQNSQANQALADAGPVPRHIAVIMDGNGRWARQKGCPRTFGHRAGAETLREIVKAASEIGVEVLSAYAFSTENWKRPAEEVSFLMRLFSDYLDNEINELDENNVKIRFIGNIGGLSLVLQNKIAKAQQQTAGNTGMVLNLAVNYGGRAEITQAVCQLAEKVQAGQMRPDEITEELIGNHLYTSGLPDPDLLIRPSGDCRISNFLLWQLAYTEFWLTDIQWPDFTPAHLLEAIQDFQRRDRRFGGLNKSK